MKCPYHHYYLKTHLPPRKTAEDGKSDRDRGIEMSPRNMTNGVNHDHYYQTPCHANTRKCDGPAVEFVDGNGSAAGKDHKICSDHLCNHLKR